MKNSQIIVDADACPRSALAICRQLGEEYKVAVWTVASFEHRIDGPRHVVAGNDPEAVDIKIANMSSRGDIVVTQDWGLAALLLGRGVNCLSPGGRIYTNQKIDFLLEERNLKRAVRKSGTRTRGPRKRTAEDDRRFEKSLRRLLHQDKGTPPA